MVFSLILLAPSWGGMINGIMTLSGAWHKLRTDPILKFLVVALSFYGMATFEGSMMSIKTVNALSHYTDWTIGHVHSGALGWVAMISIGSLYYLIPRLFGEKQMYSTRLIEWHFWIATIGVVLYIASMWIAGVMEGLMWRATQPDGTLTYAFVEAVKAKYPFYLIRLLGGLCFLAACSSWPTTWHVRSPASQRWMRRFRPTCRLPPTDRRGPTMSQNQGFFSARDAGEERRLADHRDDHRGQHRWPGADRAAVLPAFDDRAGSGHHAVLAAASDGARHLHPRGLWAATQQVRTLQAETERYGHFSTAGESV
jgi:hypothetical protein